MATIENTLKAFDDLEILAVTVIKVAKSGSIFAVLPKIVTLLTEGQHLIEDGRKAIPEIVDIDPTESGILTTRAYNLVLAVLEATAA